MSSMNNWQTRQSLIDRARDSSDQEAWEEFHNFYEPFIAYILKLQGTPNELFEEVHQKVLIKLWKKIPDFKLNTELGKFRTWMSRVIKNTLIDEIRMQKKRIEGIQELKEYQESQLNQSSNLEEKIEQEWKIFITQKAMKKVTSRFTGKAIEVFNLSLKGKKPEDIAIELELKKNTVYRLNKRVQLALREEIQALQFSFEGTKHG